MIMPPFYLRLHAFPPSHECLHCTMILTTTVLGVASGQ